MRVLHLKLSEDNRAVGVVERKEEREKNVPNVFYGSFLEKESLFVFCLLKEKLVSEGLNWGFYVINK